MLKLILLSLFFTAILSQTLMGVAVLKGTQLDPNINGVVKFYLSNDGQSIVVDANITGITVNVNLDHGMHIHQWGDISNVNGTATGGHYVGAGSDFHGCPTNTTRHGGDMGNWTVTAQGTIVQTKNLDLLPILNGGNSIIGRAVILHYTFDDCVTQPTGNASTRIAQGVIGVANPATFNTSNANTASVDNSTVTTASCVVAPTSFGGNLHGTVYFKVINGLTFITGQFFNLNASVTKRGIHIHQFGDLTSADGTAAGAHYNPDNFTHAIPPTVQRHKGDLGNLQYVDSNGTFWYYANNSYVNLNGANNVIGRAVILHITVDDGCTQPTGNSGSRIGQCVIGVIDPATVIPTAPSGIPEESQPPCATTAPTTLPTTTPTRSPSSSAVLSVSLFIFSCLLFFVSF